ncbi:MAG: InlB B-repeat-containing protein [Clostridia bacterium]|nr:InlB B-repeat-containing protein [Clostridia bacterium]
MVHLNGYCEIYQKFTTNPDENFTSNIVINGGKFAEDIYAEGHDGSNWYYSNNTKFIKGGYFAKIYDENYDDDCTWMDYVVDGLEPSNKMKNNPEGYPYSMGHKVTLNSNYGETPKEEVIYTLNNGSMQELYDFSRDGYKFVEWNTKKDGTGETITKNSTITVDTVVYAIWEVIPGNINSEVVSTEELAVSVDSEKLADIVLTDEDKALIDEGKDIKIEMNIEDITENISNEEKEKILEEIEKIEEDTVIGAFIDISIVKKINGEYSEYITTTNSKIKITINLPEELKNKETDKVNRKYSIVRYHEGEVEILDAEYDEENNTLTFETDKFSTYAIAYTDVEIKDNKADISNPKTGDIIIMAVFVLIVSTAGLVVTRKMKK